MQPIDYVSAFGPPPSAGFASAMEAGQRFGMMEQQQAALRAREQMAQQEAAFKLQQQQAASLRQQQIADAVARLQANPNRTFADYEAVGSLIFDPKQQESLRANFEAFNKDRQQQELVFTGQALSSLAGGQPEIAAQLIRERATGLRNRGEESQATALDALARATELNPAGAEVTLAGMLSALPGGDKIIEGVGKAREQRRQEAVAPFTLRKETAEAIIKEAEAKFAPEKVAAGLELTNAQIAQAKAARAASLAAADASGAEKKRKEDEASRLAAGIIPIEQRPKIETDFRKEYATQTAGYREVKSAYGRVLASQDNAVGDLSLIFGYMKMLDPGSVVREGEFATAQNAAGVPDRVLNLYNRILSGERLNESQRKSFKGQAEVLFKQAGQQEQVVRKGMERIAKGYGLNTANIFLEPTESVPTNPNEMGRISTTPQMPAGFRILPAR